MTKTDFVQKARDKWSNQVPEWVLILANEVNAQGQTKVAQTLKVSASLVSQVLSNSYPGDLVQLENKVMTVLTGGDLSCPILGAIPRTKCHENRTKPLIKSSSHSIALYRACKTCKIYERN